jgi:hypothetical protein
MDLATNIYLWLYILHALFWIAIQERNMRGEKGKSQPVESDPSQPSPVLAPPQPSTPKFGFAGLSLLIGIVIFAIQQGCAVTGTPPSWRWGSVWFSLAIILVVWATWFWDQTASHKWVRKLIISIVVVLVMGFFSYIPIARQYRTEHHKLTAVQPETQNPSPTAAEIAAEVVKRIPRQHDVEKEPQAQVRLDDRVQAKVHRAHERENPPSTVRELFDIDLSNLLKVNIDHGLSVNLTFNKQTTEVPIARKIYADFVSRSKFVGFYIPTSNMPSDEATYVACLQLPKQVQDVFSDFEKTRDLWGGISEDQMTSVKDLQFSGRVILYYEGFLSITEKAQIIDGFKRENYDVQFRGPDYLRDVQIAWRQERDSRKP